MSKRKRVIIDTSKHDSLIAQTERRLHEVTLEREEIKEKIGKLSFQKQSIENYERSVAIMEAVLLVADSMTAEQFIICTPIFARYFNEVQRTAPPSVLKKNPDFVKLARMVNEASNAVLQAEHEYDRQQKLERKREQTPVLGLETEAPKCTRCGKRPQHFDTLCKRCANETGNRPTGKI